MKHSFPKRALMLLLALLMALQLAACGGGSGSQGGGAAVGIEPAPGAEAPQYQDYVYAEGGVSIGVPLDMAAEPAKEDGAIVYRDPQGAWTVRFEPVSLNAVSNRFHNKIVEVESLQTFGYYQNVQIEELTVGGYPATRLSFSRNPDWVEASMGYTASYTESHCLLLVDYAGAAIGSAGGLFVDVSAPENSRDPLEPILADARVQTLLSNLRFHEATTELSASIPGISVKFPIRWTVGSDEKSTLWGGSNTDPHVSLFLSSSIYADPKEAAATIDADYRSVELGGRTWYGGVTHVLMTSSDYYMLRLLTDFTPYHALELKLSILNADEAEHWAYTESDVFRGIVSSLVLEPDAFQDPEKDRMDSSGFTCNNINEVDSYTGSDAEITIPAVIGSNEIVGVRSSAFKGNETITKVTLAEGIQYIDYGAFSNCTNLEVVILPNSLTVIDSRAFEGCSSLREVRFGEGLRVIDSNAFADCSALGDVKLPESLVYVGDNAFHRAGNGSGSFLAPAEGVTYARCALLEASFNTVEFGPGADLSADAILADSLVNRVVIGSGCKALGNQFLGAPVYNDASGMWHYVDTPLTVQLNGVEKIGEYAFEGREGLTAVDLRGVQELGRRAFAETGLVNILVPGSIKEVPDGCFSNCKNALTITLEEGVERVGVEAFLECGRIYPDQWYLRFYTEEEAAQMGDKIVPNGSADFDNALTIYLPSTLQYADDWSFGCLFISGLYMLWCTEPDMLPEFHTDAFYACEYIYQFYFTEETIEQYGDDLDLRLNQLSDVGEPAWYYMGYEPYWAAVKPD